MPAFHALDHYSPWIVLLAGLATFGGAWGTGFALLRALGLRLPSPWCEVIAALLGTVTFSLAVQVAAMLDAASTRVLVSLWLALVLTGSLGGFLRLRHRAWDLPSLPRGWGLLVAGAVLLAALVNLLLAMAPSTKIDEINYMMLPPSRIVADGGLSFHLRPWPAAILPQMGYPIAAAPLLALGRIDAANVWSWCLGLLLAWFGARLVREQTRSAIAALVTAAAIVIGLYPSVYHTTGGPHALGDLAMAGAVLATAFREELLRRCTAASYLALLSVCCLAAAFTKVSLVPLAGSILLLGLALALRSSPRDWPGLLAAASVPWVVFYLPLVLWTFWSSGSPFGPLLSGLFGGSVYGETIRADMAKALEVNRVGPLHALRSYLVHYPALFLAAALAAFFSPALPRRRRLLLAAIAVAQLLVIAVLLPHKARFLSGVHHALLVVGVVGAYPYLSRGPGAPALRAAVLAALLVPWLAVQVYRGWFLAPIALGIGEKDDYYRDFIALYDDFRELDRLLPDDAVLYVRDRWPLVYLPRPVYLDRRDLPPGQPAFTLLAEPDGDPEALDCAYLRLGPGCRLGDPVYGNERAQTVVFRRPGREPVVEKVESREILDAGKDPRASRPPRPGEGAARGLPEP